MSFDKKIKNKLEGFQPAPSNKVWQKIESQLDSPKVVVHNKNDYVLVYGVLTFIVFLSIAFILNNRLNTSNYQANQNAKNATLNLNKQTKIRFMNDHLMSDAKNLGSSKTKKTLQKPKKNILVKKEHEALLKERENKKGDHFDDYYKKEIKHPSLQPSEELFYLGVLKPFLNAKASINKINSLSFRNNNKKNKLNPRISYKMSVRYEKSSLWFNSNKTSSNEELKKFLNTNFSKIHSISYGFESYIQIKNRSYFGVGIGVKTLSFISNMKYNTIEDNLSVFDEDKVKSITPFGFWFSDQNEYNTLKNKASKITVNYVYIPISYEYYFLNRQFLGSISLENQVNILANNTFQIKESANDIKLKKSNVLGQKKLFNELTLSLNIEKNIGNKMLLGVSPFLKTSTGSISKTIDTDIKTMMRTFGVGIYVKY